MTLALQVDKENTKLEYATILESIEQFNTRLTADYDRLDAMKKLLDSSKNRGSDIL